MGYSKLGVLTIFEPKCRGLKIFAIFGGLGNPVLPSGLIDKLNRSGQAMAEVWEAIGCIMVTKLALKNEKTGFFSI